jgi:aspartate aminotransferase-like enzyme
MKDLIFNLRRNFQQIAKTKTNHIYCVAGSSSAAMEATIANLVTEKSRVLVIGTNGEFNKRWIELLDLHSFSFTVLKPEERKSVSFAMVKDKLDRKEFDICLITHGETSNGIMLKDIKPICKLLKKKGVLSIVDAVSTLGALEFKMDDWGIDVVVSGSQKALGSVTGLGIFALSNRAYLLALKSKPTRWLYDFAKITKFWDKGGYHYTAPGGLLLALNQAMQNICNYGVDRWIKDHVKASSEFIKKLQSEGFKLYANNDHQLSSVIAIETEAKNPARIVEFIKNKYEIEISGSFGLNVVRIGQMNLQILPENQKRTLIALKDALNSVVIDNAFC